MAFVQEQEIDPRRVAQSEERGELECISTDDVLDMHRFLESFEGDCRTLLRGASEHREDVNQEEKG